MAVGARRRVPVVDVFSSAAAEDAAGGRKKGR